MMRAMVGAGLGAGGLSLSLFVAWIFADDAHDAFAPHDATGFAESFDGRFDFHLGRDAMMAGFRLR
jgi:hypothetical protein